LTDAQAVPVAIGRKRTHNQITQESDENFDEQMDAILPAIILPGAQVEDLPPPTPTRSLPALTPSPPKNKGRKKVPKATTGRKAGGRKRRN